MSKKLYIDPGHGGRDPGAVGNGLREKDVVLKISLYLRDYILKNYKGILVRLSRTTDKYVTLAERSRDANRWGADLFISEHINAGGGVGYEDFRYQSLSATSNAGKFQNETHKRSAPLFSRDRGKKSANFHVLRETAMPAVLPENGFIDNKRDAEYLSKDSNLRKIAEAHAKAAAAYFGLEKGSSNASSASSNSSSGTIYRVRKTASDAKTQRGAFSNRNNAEKLADKNKGYKVYNDKGNLIYNPGSSSSVPKAPKPAAIKAVLTVDGKWGRAATRALQRYFGTTVDGVMSGQSSNSVTNSLYGNTVSFGSGGSMVVRALQRYLNSKGYNLLVDGLLGAATVRALQSYLGTTVDGTLSRPSMAVRELQRRLNAGTF